MNGDTLKSAELKSAVQERYGSAAKAVLKGRRGSCCGGASASEGAADPITSGLYDAEQAAGVPEDALLASLGCGNPTALAELKPGEAVLDLGSGGGIDVLLSARRVGPTGKAYGLDMTPEMLELARRNQQKAGVRNVEFLKGSIEEIPLPDATVDVIISNCVINLSGDKDRVLREAFRVLKPGGRFAVSDIVVRRELPEAARRSMALWTGCIGGALVEADYVKKLRAAGFEGVEVEPTRVYVREDLAEMAQANRQEGSAETLAAMDGAIMSAFIRARKPAAAALRPSADEGSGERTGNRAGCCGGSARAKAEAPRAEEAAAQDAPGATAKAAESGGCGCAPSAMRQAASKPEAPKAAPRSGGGCC